MIGIFNDNFPPIMDGVALTAKNYAHWLSHKGEKVSVITPYAPNYLQFDASANYDILRYPSIPIPMRKPYRFGMPYIDWMFHHRLKQMPFTLIHAHCPFTSGKLALEISRKRQIPLVATFHSKYRQDFERVFHSKWIVDLIIHNIVSFYNQADAVWIPQAAVEPTLREYGYEGPVEVVENGNDFSTPYKRIQDMRAYMREELGIAPNETMLLFVGQHIWEKNIGFILEALSLIKDKPYHLFMVGTGYAVREIRHRIVKLGLDSHVTLLGNIHDRERLKRIDAAADLFLFPSLYDNAPLVVREAAAMHTAALMLKESTAAEVIQPDMNGFLTGNDTQEYADKIVYLMEHPDILKRVGDNASKTISRSWEDIIDEVILRYKDIEERTKSKYKR